MTKDVEDLLNRHKTLKGQRRGWEDHWQQLAEVMLPRRADFSQSSGGGEKRADQIYDSTPMLARRGLSAAIDGLLKPRTSRWFHVKVADGGDDENDEAKAWLEDTEERMARAIYNPRARFIQRSGEVDDDLVTFGTGVLFIGESKGLNRLLFRSVHLRDAYPAENGDGEIDTLFLTMTLTARQAAQKYGEENLGSKTLEALKTPNAKPDDKFAFLQAVLPRVERDSRLSDNQNLSFASVIIDVGSEHKVTESGFHEFPYAVPRWDTATGELFGRSPGMLALPDSRTLQEMGKTILIAGQKAVDPPLLVASDSVNSTLQTFPGGVSAFDVEAARDLGGRPPIMPLNTGGNIPLGREMQNDLRDQIFSAFFRNVLQLPINAPKMTATEVLERKEEFIRTIGPVFGRLETDYIGHVVQRVFNIMTRAGHLAPAPEALAGREVRFEYSSPVEQARRQTEAAGAARSIELLSSFISADPGVMDNFDGDEIARDTPDIFGLPSRWLRSKDEVEARRQTRAKASQAQTMLSGASQLAQVAKTAADAGFLKGGG